MRFAPPYVVTREELDEGLRILEESVVALAPPPSQV